MCRKEINMVKVISMNEKYEENNVDGDKEKNVD